MIERRRLPSATYHSPSEEKWSRELFADQFIAVHSQQHNTADVARHVADKQISGCPFFVMDVPAVLSAIKEWNNNLARFQPHYAVRCNPDPVLARLLAEYGEMCFEVSNGQELEMALELVPASRVMYSNPLWTRKAMRLAGEAGVGTIVISCEKELYDAVSYAPDAKLLIAVSLGCPMREEAISAALGVDGEEAEALLVTATELRANIAGFSFNIDNADPGIYYKAIREVRQLFDQAREFGLRPNTLAVGGGFRFPRESDDKTRFHEVGHALRDSIERYFPAHHYPNMHFIASPGRFFASPAFTLCTNVVSKRAVDVSMIGFDRGPAGETGYVYQTNEGIYGSFSCRLVDCDPKCRPLRESSLYEPYHVGTVLGPTLDGIDVAQSIYVGRQLSVGEWLMWENMGAYSISMDPDMPSPPVYYFAGRDNWNNIISKRASDAGHASTGFDDNSSDAASDVESVVSDEDDDLITRFDNFFDF